MTDVQPPTRADRSVAGAEPDDAGRTASAVSLRGRPVRKAPMAWLPRVALGLLGLLLLVAVLIATTAGDGDGDGDGDQAAEGAAAGEVSPTTAAATPDPAAPESSNTGESIVVSGGMRLLPPSAATLGSVAGRDVEGKGVRVESVVADEGFWIGDDPTSRLFVVLSGTVTASAAESPFQVQAGQRIDFEGTVERLPDDAGALGVDAGEGAEQLREQGHYLELSSVRFSD